MSVRVGQKFARGQKGDASAKAVGYMAVDVTSGSGNKIGGILAKTLSPMTLGPVKDAESGLTAQRFENYWQGGKMWKTADHMDEKDEPTDAWRAFRKKIYANPKGQRTPLPKKQYGFASSSYYNGKIHSYIESRKQIYVPIYRSLIESMPIIIKLKALLKSGQNILVIDGDGPPKKLYPNGLIMNATNWNKMINDPTHPFGHGYVVAALLADLQIDHVTLIATDTTTTSFDALNEKHSEMDILPICDAKRAREEDIDVTDFTPLKKLKPNPALPTDTEKNKF